MEGAAAQVPRPHPPPLSDSRPGCDPEALPRRTDTQRSCCLCREPTYALHPSDERPYCALCARAERHKVSRARHYHAPRPGLAIEEMAKDLPEEPTSPVEKWIRSLADAKKRAARQVDIPADAHPGRVCVACNKLTYDVTNGTPLCAGCELPETMTQGDVDLEWAKMLIQDAFPGAVEDPEALALWDLMEWNRHCDGGLLPPSGPNGEAVVRVPDDEPRDYIEGCNLCGRIYGIAWLNPMELWACASCRDAYWEYRRWMNERRWMKKK